MCYFFKSVFFIETFAFCSPVESSASTEDDEFLEYLKYKRNLMFGLPMSEEEIDTMSRKRYEKSTHYNIRWVLAMYQTWKWQRNRVLPAEQIKVDLQDESTFNKEDMYFALCRFYV